MGLGRYDDVDKYPATTPVASGIDSYGDTVMLQN